ncbi:MAG: Rne/Rng family ribonuclease [Endomicrobium sp.]|jgi:ribonuclease G|nr:Rne/Rng family ribonuclease [Endomicrobium sp.]
MKKKVIIVVNKSIGETKVAVLENDKLFDLFIEVKESEKILNNIYRGRVQNIVPALGSAFVDIGINKSAYLSVDNIVSRCSEKNIKNMIKSGQDIIVQVYKEAINNKGPKVTMNISLPGRLLVYIPFGNNVVGVSKKIKNKQECKRLRDIANEVKKNVSGGIIVRTEAEKVKEVEIKNEVSYLTRLWVSIVEKFKNVESTNLIHKDLGIVLQIVRDYFSDDVTLMHIDSRKEFNDVVDFVKIVVPELADKIVFYNSKVPIFKLYGIEEEIDKLCSNKVGLNSGGYIVIQEAESLCAIDVNSGKFTSKFTQEETAVLTNLEASEEIARQLRLRNIGGIIVIDFIDMKKAADRRRVLDRLCEAAMSDKAKIKVWPMINKLGLIEMTRERKKKSLFSLLSDACPVCQGLGFVFSKKRSNFYVDGVK